MRATAEASRTAEPRIAQDAVQTDAAVAPGALAGSDDPMGAAVRDEVRARRGRPPYYLPVFAPPGGAGAVIDPDHHRLLARAAGTGPTWRNEFAARLFLHPPRYLEGTAERVGAPLLVCVAEHDTETNARAAAGIARTAPRGEVLSYPVGHFDVYEDPWQHRMIEDQAGFLSRHLWTGTEADGH